VAQGSRATTRWPAGWRRRRARRAGARETRRASQRAPKKGSRDAWQNLGTRRRSTEPPQTPLSQSSHAVVARAAIRLERWLRGRGYDDEARPKSPRADGERDPVSPVGPSIPAAAPSHPQDLAWSRWLSGAVGGIRGSMPLAYVLRGSVSDLISVRAQLRKVVTEKRQQPLTESERAALASALRSTEEALATLADLAGVRYPP